MVRPGNCIRHLAGREFVGWSKVEATKAVMSRTGLSIDYVVADYSRVFDRTGVQSLFSGADLVIDATADFRTTSLLASFATQFDEAFLSVALLRQGAIVVVDRIPPRATEGHLPFSGPLPGEPEDLRERGCGDAVSRTPPGSVVSAAALVVRLATDELLERQVPSTTFEVLRAQPDEPFKSCGLVSSS